MISSRWWLLPFAFTTVAWLCCTPATAQDMTPEEVEREAIRAYLWATRVESEGYGDPDGGAGTNYLDRALEACSGHAVRSYRTMPSRLASWRLASCASGMNRHVVAFLAFRAFEELTPEGVLAWTHNSVDAEDRVRVIAAFAGVRDRIGGTRLGPVPEGHRVVWQGHQPVSVSPGEVPEPDAQIVLFEGVLYGPVGRLQVGQVVADGQEPRSFHFRFQPLSAGVQDIVLREPEAEQPVIQQPEPAPIARVTAPRPMPAATQRRPPPVTYYVEEVGGASGMAVLGWTGAIVGVLTAGSGALLWGLADSIRQDLDAACPTRTGCSAALRSDYEQGRDFTLGGNILTIAGGALAVLGVVFLVIDVATMPETTVAVRASASRVELQIGGTL